VYPSIGWEQRSEKRNGLVEKSALAVPGKRDEKQKGLGFWENVGEESAFSFGGCKLMQRKASEGEEAVY